MYLLRPVLKKKKRNYSTFGNYSLMMASSPKEKRFLKKSEKIVEIRKKKNRNIDVWNFFVNWGRPWFPPVLLRRTWRAFMTRYSRSTAWADRRRAPGGCFRSTVRPPEASWEERGRREPPGSSLLSKSATFKAHLSFRMK